MPRSHQRLDVRLDLVQGPIGFGTDLNENVVSEQIKCGFCAFALKCTQTVVVAAGIGLGMTHTTAVKL